MHVDGLKPDDRIDIARPSTTSASDLSWEQPDQLSVLASWTNTGAAQEVQVIIFICGLIGGIGVTFLCTALLQIMQRVLPEKLTSDDELAAFPAPVIAHSPPAVTSRKSRN